MRIMSFSEKWPKLYKSNILELFTTWRWEREDRDWGTREVLQVYYKARSPAREKLGIARIMGKELRRLESITDEEAREDGFNNREEMISFLEKSAKYHMGTFRLHKLTLKWVERIGK